MSRIPEGNKEMYQKDNTQTSKFKDNDIIIRHKQISEIFAQLRILAGVVHAQQNTDIIRAFHQYFSDITGKYNELNQSIRKEISVCNQKQTIISELKLQLKASKNDFSEMKSSLILEMQQQRIVVDQLKEEIRLQRERVSDSLLQIMEETKRKDEQIKKMKQQHEDQIIRIKQKSRRNTLSNQKTDNRNIQFQQKQHSNLMKSQDIRREKQKDQFLQLISFLDAESQHQQDLINYFDEMFSKRCELQVSLLQKQAQIMNQVNKSDLTSSKSIETGVLLSQKTQQVLELKEKIGKLNKTIQSKQVQITDLRSIMQKYLKQKQQNNKYLGTKWQHQIERVMLNAEIEFDREKNRIKRAGDERLIETEKMLGQKINQLRQQNKNIREVKLKKAIQMVRQLQINVKQLQAQKVSMTQIHNHQISQLKKTISQMNTQIEVLNSQYRTSLNQIEQQKIHSRETLNQLEYLRLTLRQKQMALKAITDKQLQVKKKQLQQQKTVFITQSKNTHQQIIKKYQEQHQILEKQRQLQFKQKSQQLFAEVERTKRQYQQLSMTKISQAVLQKEDLKRNYDKALKQYKYEQKARQQQLNKSRNKLLQQVKQFKETIVKNDDEINQLKQKILFLQKQIKIRDQTLRNQQAQIKSLQFQFNQQHSRYEELQKLYHHLNDQKLELQGKYNDIHNQIQDLKKYFLKQHENLKQQHLKIVKSYRSYIKQIIQSCFSSSDRNVYIREIKRLRTNTSGMETQLKNAQVKLQTMKEMERYQSNKIEILKSTSQEKESYTYRSEGRMKTKYLNTQRINNQQSLDKTSRKQQQSPENNQTKYFKLSNIRRKSKGPIFHPQKLKQSKVGLGRIDTYSMIESQKDYFRLLTSPRMEVPFKKQLKQ